MAKRRRSNRGGMSIFEQVETARADRREMMVYGPVDTVMAHDVSSAIEHYASLNKKPITITMNTPGGSVVDGLSIYDSIKRVTAKGIKVRIIATGACMSMGTIILQAATERLSTPHTAFLLHELSMINIGTLGQQKDRHEEALRLQKVLNGILSERSGLSDAKLKVLVERRDLYMTAAEAKQWRLIDKVI